MKHSYKDRLSSKQKVLLIVSGMVILVCIVVAFMFLTQPERSVSNFCKVAKEQKPMLVGDVNYEKRLDAYKKLETVSPDNIRPDISTIRKGYEEIVKSPSNTLSTGLGMSGAENRRTAYIESNCQDF